MLAAAGCGEPQPDERPDRLTLPAPRNGLQLVEEAAAGLRRAQIGVSDIGLRRPTLDDVFLQLTGAPPSENGGGPSPRTRRRPRPQPPAPAPDVPAPRRPVLRLRRPSPQAVRSAITDTAVVTGRNLRHFIRQPDLLVFSTIQPVLFVLLFVYVFGGAIGRSLPHGVAYVNFLLPGVFVQSVTFGASQTAVGLKEDLTRGVVDRFRSMPMARSAVLAGRTVADLVRNIVVIFLMIAVGYLVGFRFLGGVAGAAGCIAVVAAFGFALSWIFAVVALTVRGAETAQTAGFVVIFPLVFASSVFVPVATFPDWLQAFATINPVTVTADAARSLALFGTTASLGAAAAWIGGLLAVFIPLSAPSPSTCLPSNTCSAAGSLRSWPGRSYSTASGYAASAAAVTAANSSAPPSACSTRWAWTRSPTGPGPSCAPPANVCPGEPWAPTTCSPRKRPRSHGWPAKAPRTRR